MTTLFLLLIAFKTHQPQACPAYYQWMQQIEACNSDAAIEVWQQCYADKACNELQKQVNIDATCRGWM